MRSELLPLRLSAATVKCSVLFRTLYFMYAMRRRPGLYLQRYNRSPLILSVKLWLRSAYLIQLKFAVLNAEMPHMLHSVVGIEIISAGKRIEGGIHEPHGFRVAFPVKIIHEYDVVVREIVPVNKSVYIPGVHQNIIIFNIFVKKFSRLNQIGAFIFLTVDLLVLNCAYKE